MTALVYWRSKVGSDRLTAEERDMRSADLRDVWLEDADLGSANLRGAIVTDEQPARAKTLAGATLPDGTVHE